MIFLLHLLMQSHNDVTLFVGVGRRADKGCLAFANGEHLAWYLKNGVKILYLLCTVNQCIPSFWWKFM